MSEDRLDGRKTYIEQLKNLSPDDYIIASIADYSPLDKIRQIES